MHLLALPTTHADAENTRRKKIQDGGTTTASRLLAQGLCPAAGGVGLRPAGTHLPGGGGPAAAEQLPLRAHRHPARPDRQSAAAASIQWQDTSAPPASGGQRQGLLHQSRRVRHGHDADGRLGWHHIILLCLSRISSASTELLDALNACGDYALFCSSLSRAVPSRTGGLTTEGLLRPCGTDVSRLPAATPRPCCKSCPATRERGDQLVGFNTHRDRGGMMGHHGGSGFQLWPEPRSGHQARALAGRLTGLRNTSEFLVYNQDLMRLWVGKNRLKTDRKLIRFFSYNLQHCRNVYRCAILGAIQPCCQSYIAQTKGETL